ncbi:MAG: hypothetical protein HY010_11250 [Acidobacteria bacterium]|nr:hypothetical protein [Acidobacteriota bacterium]
MYISLFAVFVVAVTVLFALGFYYAQKRFWSQDRNHSPTAPPSPPEGTGNTLDDNDPIWRPPKSN